MVQRPLQCLHAAGAPVRGRLSAGFSTSLRGDPNSPTPYRALHGSTPQGEQTPLGISMGPSGPLASPEPGRLATCAPAADATQ
jgi:hypothetical protein